MSSLSMRPLSPVLGAEVSGMDFSREPDEETARQLLEWFRDRHALLFRDVKLSVEEQARFGRLFGTITVRGDYGQNEFAETQHISNSRPDGMLGDGELGFHHDQLFYPDPLKAIMLYGMQVTRFGGETLLCNGTLAYERLPAEFKAELEGLTCLHVYNYKSNPTEPDFARKAGPEGPRYVHPLVWTNPETGRKTLWFSNASTLRVNELDERASQAMLMRLRDEVQRPSYIYAHHWQVGDLLIWSNHMLQHARTPFDPAEPRTLRRTPIVERVRADALRMRAR